MLISLTPTCSIGAVPCLLDFDFTLPAFLMGGGHEKGAILLSFVLIATIATFAYSHNFPHTCCRKASRFHSLRQRGILLVALSLLGALIGVLWQWERVQGMVLTTIGAPVMFFGAWAWALWCRKRYLETNLREGSQTHQTHDPITGLLNHHAIYARLEEAFHQTVEDGQPLSIMRVDIDRFALYDATHGPLAGDTLLQGVGQIIAQIPVSGQVAGRYDADEFLIVLPYTGRAQATALAFHLQEQIRQSPLAFAGNGKVVPITTSIGIASYPEDAKSVQALLSTAEETLEVAKRNGSGVADTQASWRTRYGIREDGDFSTLGAMVVAIDNKDRYTRQHSEDVTEYALWIAEELGLPEDQKYILRLAGLVHDVGKIGVPDEVLLKPDVLNPSEYEKIKQHAVLGAVMLAALPNMEHLAPIVRGHHERWDGTGYPDGLAGEQIPLMSRVLAVADAFSAMTTDRLYRKGMDWETALAEIERQRCKQFDPVIADAFLTAVRKRMRRTLSKQDALPQAA